LKKKNISYPFGIVVGDKNISLITRNPACASEDLLTPGLRKPLTTVIETLERGYPTPKESVTKCGCVAEPRRFSVISHRRQCLTHSWTSPEEKGVDYAGKLRHSFDLPLAMYRLGVTGSPEPQITCIKSELQHLHPVRY